MRESDDRGEVGMGTSALLLATARAAGGGPAAVLELDGTSVLGHLLGQLEGLGVRRTWLVTRPGWKDAVEAAAASVGAEATVVSADDGAEELRLIADAAETVAESAGPLVVGGAHVVAHREALALLLADPRIASGILASASPVDPNASSPIRSADGRVVSAGSPYHRVTRATGSFLGLMKVDARDCRRLAALARQLAESARERPPDGHAPAGEAMALLLVGLVRTGVAVFAAEIGRFFYAAPLSSEAAGEAARELSSRDEERVLLESSVKANDSFFTTFLVSPYSKYVARFTARRGWSPNVVTFLSFAVGLAAAASFAAGSRLGLIAGALLLQVSFTADCVDGQLARYTRTFSKLGGWLDAVFDRTKEYAVYAGLAIGASRGGDDVWTLAAAALALQTVRHMLDVSYETFERTVTGSAAVLPLEQADDEAATIDRPHPGVAQPAIAPGSADAARARRRPAWLRWGHRIVRLPIGERYALISLTAAIASPRVTFVALLAWGGAAAAYAAAGWTLAAYPSTARVVRALAK